MKTIKMDFNDLGWDEDGIVTGSQKYASSTLYVGDMVLAIEHPGYTCIASVVAAEINGVVRLALDPVTWQDPIAA